MANNFITKNKEAFLLMIFIAVVSISFWSFSRYPQLIMKSGVVERSEMSEKSLMEGKITHRISYDEAEDSIYIKIYNTTLNWVSANKRGMSFGMVIGAAFLSLLKFLSLKSSKNNFLNSLYGMITGIPLGVCSNCVAPVMKGSFMGGSKMGYSLSMMFSSPMLNVIVLTILFSTFPLKLAVANLIAALILILVVTPIFVKKRAKKFEEIAACNLDFSQKKVTTDSWFAALQNVIITYGKDFIFLFIRVVPLMLFAGFLGAVAVNLLSPAEFFSQSTISIYILIIFAAFFAAILPMPIAIDLMLAQSMMIAGVPLSIVATFVFALGSYSIYSFLIVKQTFSLKTAIEIYFIIVTIAAILGFMAL